MDFNMAQTDLARERRDLTPTQVLHLPNTGNVTIASGVSVQGGMTNMRLRKLDDWEKRFSQPDLDSGSYRRWNSHQLVQENDKDEQEEIAPLRIRKRETQILSPALVQSTTFSQSDFEDMPARTASVSRNLPLSHPRPDLQSMQGGYVKNVERLEESAERLSMTSSLDEEIQKLKFEQRQLQRQSSAPTRIRPRINDSGQFSFTSHSNSILDVNATARCGGYSPSSYATTFKDATLSRSWSQISSQDLRLSTAARVASQRQSLEAERRYQELPYSEPPLPPPHLIPYANRSNSFTQTDGRVRRVRSDASANRPVTSRSNDTSRQASSLFRDFDGTHYIAALSRETSLRSQISLEHPPLATDSAAHREPQLERNTVYYPAPVPMMLNLPPKLSNFSSADKERRRLQALSAIPADMRDNANWLQSNVPTDQNRSETVLPPQLRANAFFEFPSIPQDVNLVGGSASAALDSILDAGIHAPIGASADHPITGHGGKGASKKGGGRTALPGEEKTEKKKKRRNSFSNMLGVGRRTTESGSVIGSGPAMSREFKAEKLDWEGGSQSETGSVIRMSTEVDRAVERSLIPDVKEETDSEGDDNEDEGVSLTSDSGVAVAPTTLIAELQMRKAQQKQRNRTAADALPNGMHSTLLELDAVTQLQQKARRQKHISLAWEDQKLADRENFDDEDVPLGVLFPGQQDQVNANRPLGLLEKLEMEENEPLSYRKERLKGSGTSTIGQARSVRSVAVPGPSAVSTIPENEEETLAQRVRRLKLEKEMAASGSSIKGVSRQVEKENVPPARLTSMTPEAEETLGHRRKKLKDEASKHGGEAGHNFGNGSVQSTSTHVHRTTVRTDSRHNMAGIPGTSSVNGTWISPREPGYASSKTNAPLPWGYTQAQHRTAGAAAAAPFANPYYVAMPSAGYGAAVPPSLMAPMMPGFGTFPSQYPYQYHQPQPFQPLQHFQPGVNMIPMYSPIQMQMAAALNSHQHQQPSQTVGGGTGLGSQEGPPLDPNQMDSIESWRQNIVYN